MSASPDRNAGNLRYRTGLIRGSLGLVALACLGATIVVDDDGGTPDLTTALASALPGDTVLVRPGTYVGSFEVSEQVSLVGSGPDLTILDGDGAERTVSLQREARVSGFTITGGGHGIEGLGANEVSGNVILENGGELHGGGVLMLGCGAVITTNVIAGNEAQVRGGGAYLFLAPVATCEPGDASPLVQNNLFLDNTSGGNGSAISTRDTGSFPWDQKWPVITQNTVVGNSSGSAGGALFFTSDSDVYSIPLPTGQVTNNVIAGNTGGGIAQYIYGGVSGYVYGPEISNNILFDNGEPEPQAPGTSIGMDGNVAMDPLFRTPAGGDYRLQPGSPAIDVGAALVQPATADLDGLPRPLEGNLDGIALPDLGAYEETGEVSDLTLAADAISVSWSERAGAAFFNLYRGSLHVLLAGGDYAQDPEAFGQPNPARRWCDLSGPVASDDEVPAVDAVFFYLATPGGLAEGTLGFDSSLQPRPNANPCP